MSELEERGWAVMSERGREATGLTYSEARKLERDLASRKISGLCIITASAASHLPAAKKKEAKQAGANAVRGDLKGAGAKRRAAGRESAA